MTHEEQQALFDTILRRANLPGSFNVENGIRLTSLSDGGAEGEVRLTAGHLNPLGIVHGGVYCTLLDQVAGAAACTRGSRGLTVNCETRFLGIARGDVLCGHAQAIHMGRTLVVMHAWVTDSQDTLCADGTYTCDVTLEGGSGRATVDSPAALTVADGRMTATIVWSSSHYDYMLVDGERCDVLSTENGSTFEIPVAALDTPLAVVGDTTAMSTPHEIDYTLTFDASSAEVNG